MSTAYARAMALSRDEKGVHHGVLEPGWYTARGAFGGLVAAQMLRSMIDVLGEPDCFPRALTVHFAAPPTGAIEIASEVVRGGKRVKHLASRYRSEGEIACFGSASFGKERPDARAYQMETMPVFDPPDRVRPIERRGLLPAFISHFDVRYCSPTLPYSGVQTPTFAAWIKLQEPEPFDAPMIAMFLDLLPPAVAATFDTFRPVASVDFTVQFFSHEPYPQLDPTKHLLITIRSRWAGDGYAEEMRDLWSPDGRLLGQCRQVVAVI